MADKQWHSMMTEVLRFGEPRADRTGVGTRALFGLRERFDMRAGFPAVTTKRLPFAQVAAELAAFVRGAQSAEEFRRLGCSFWDGNAASEYWLPRARFQGDVGRIYGVQWRRWRSVAPGRFEEVKDAGAVEAMLPEMPWKTTDQLADVAAALKKDPHGRRHLVTAWNPGEMDQMCLPPCHAFMQFYAADAGGRWLDLLFYMRSVDLFLGMPCDIATYALLCHLMAKETGRAARFLTVMTGDAHVYNNHAYQAEEAMRREPYQMPQLSLSPRASLFDFDPGHASLVGYSHHPAIVAPLNV